MSLAEKIERLYHQQTTDYGREFFDAFEELKQGLNSGEIRAAEPAPGGSSIQDGSYLGKGVVCLPPIFVNVGAYVDDGVMMDSRALVGSCAQVGKRVHVGARL